MEYERATLSNGLRVLVSEMPETRSVSLALYVGVGSRAETKLNAGTSHFLEHMVFKGTAKRPSAPEISQAVESLGGVVNASTDKEVTVFWSRVPARHYLVALDVIADMIRAPMLREIDVSSEKRVVVEEIRMYRDQPQDRVHTLIDELLYPDHPLGWEVAGREKVVSELTAEGLRGFMERGYAPDRIVVALAGKLDAKEAIAAVEAQLGDLAPRAAIPLKPAPPPSATRTRMLGKRGEQAHLCIGWRGVPQGHPDKFIIDMLNAVLGEGMSSRLFLELREKRALAYDVHSYDANYSDAGHLIIYAGVAPKRAAEALTTALTEVARLRDEPVGDAELERVRDFAKGRIELRLEDTRGVSSWLAGQEMFLGRVRSVEEVCAIVDSIGADDIQRVARQYLRTELCYIAAVGPRATIATLGTTATEDAPMEIAS
ncbi:MAG: insulinase family protein [Chloroflexi bacterium]|nr:insulinase family protein [Chloroflexota bacterium]